MAENAKERLVRYLQDAHAAEEGGLNSLKDIAAEATDPQLKAAVSEHIIQTQTQIDRLHTRIIALGGSPNEAKGFLNSVIGKGSDLLNVFHDKEDKQTQDLIKAYSLEAFEVGFYTSLKAYAAAISDTETESLADQIIGEEQIAGEKLLRLIPQVAVLVLGQTAAV